MKFYLRTLGYTHDTFIRNIFKSVNEQNKVLSSPDKCGQHEPIHKLTVDEIHIIRKHIMLYNPSINHYRRKHTRTVSTFHQSLQSCQCMEIIIVKRE